LPANFNLLRRLFVQIGPILKFNGLSVITNDVVEASEYPRERRHIALEKDRHLPSKVTGFVVQNFSQILGFSAGAANLSKIRCFPTRAPPGQQRGVNEQPTDFLR